MPKFQSSVISIRQLCALANVEYFSLYNRRKGLYKADLDFFVKAKVAEALIRDITPFVRDLGFDVIIRPTKE